MTAQWKKILQREIKQLTSQYELINDKLTQAELVLDDIQKRDDNIYRLIFEADPIPKSIRKAGYGGVNRYSDLSGYNNSELVISTSKKIDQITNNFTYNQDHFDEVIELAKDKANMLSSIPAIQPVSNKDLSRMASGLVQEYIQFIKLEKCMQEWIFQPK